MKRLTNLKIVKNETVANDSPIIKIYIFLLSLTSVVYSIY